MADHASGAALDVPDLAIELGALFADAGHELYLVGGSVRDLLLGRDVSDLDFATSAHPAETTKVLHGWADRRYFVGVRFGTVGALKEGTRLEITTFRQEVYAEQDRKPAVTFGRDIETDLGRRDFTINAMAVWLPGGELIDPHGGAKALGARVLDTPTDPAIAFSDDPLRMIRAARFVAQLDVVPAERVIEGIRAMRDRLDIVAVERMQAEIDKLLVAEHPAKGLSLLVDTGLADVFLPELPALRLEQDPVHQHKDVLRHTYAVVERCEPDLVLRLAGLLHDIGKPKTRQVTPEGVSFHHHEIVGARMARERLTSLRYPNAIVDDVCTLIELHLRFHGYGEGWTDAAVRRYVRDAGPLLDRLNQLTRADVTTRNADRARRFAALQDELEERIAALAEQENLEAIRPSLDGRQVMERLGVPPGPVVGEALAYLLDVRMERGPISEDEAFVLLDAWGKERGLAG
ncbi:MAG: CCA tRNA nucleotidyltransferase [Actinobacteria bacterium]|nr:MAG: CCA tRNA nucleotidyltransferase [Actinomycetota bacterium]